MKKILFILFFVLSSMLTILTAQEHLNTERLLQNYIPATYRLYPTQNIYTFIKLNTRNGLLWQVQYDLKGSNRFEIEINFLSLASKDKEINDRFILHPTQNMYNFILLDQIDGRMWQVQWSMETKNRVVIPIN